MIASANPAANGKPHDDDPTCAANVIILLPTSADAQAAWDASKGSVDAVAFDLFLENLSGLEELCEARDVVAVLPGNAPPALREKARRCLEAARPVAHEARAVCWESWQAGKRFAPPNPRVIPPSATLAFLLNLPDAELAPGKAKAEPYVLKAMGSIDLATREFPREWLISGLLVSGQPAVVGGPRKGLKTSLMVDLVVALASGQRFLGEFVVPLPRRTLFLSGESGDATIQETARRVCEGRDLDLDALEGWAFWGFDLPQLSRPDHLAALAEFIRDKGIEVVVIDPLYLCLIGGGPKIDPANLFDTGPLLKLITGACLEAGATPILVHHLRKNRDDHNAPPELEDLAYSGVQEFARQWILIGRREQYEPGTGEHKLWLSVGGSAGHSGAWALDVSEGVVGEDFGGRHWRVGVTRASEARGQTREQEQAALLQKAADRRRLADEQAERQIAEDADATLAKLRTLRRATKVQLREAFRWSGTRIGSALARLGEQGRIRPVDVLVRSGKGQRTEGGFEPADEPPGGPLFRTRTYPDIPGQNPDCPGTASPDGVPGQEGGSPPFRGEPPPVSGYDSGCQPTPEQAEKPRTRTDKRPGMKQGKAKAPEPKADVEEKVVEIPTRMPTFTLDDFDNLPDPIRYAIMATPANHKRLEKAAAEGSEKAARALAWYAKQPKPKPGG